MHLLISQDFPVVPAGHAQEKSSRLSVQAPPYWHGLEAQSSGSNEKKHTFIQKTVLWFSVEGAYIDKNHTRRGDSSDWDAKKWTEKTGRIQNIRQTSICIFLFCFVYLLLLL